jgi:hypothetical protein
MLISKKVLFTTLGVVSFYASCGDSKVLSTQSSEISPDATQGAESGSELTKNDIIFGPELEFTDPKSGDASYSSKALFMSELAKQCESDKEVVCDIQSEEYNPSFEVKEINGKARVKGFPYNDPAVLEIPLDPMSLEQAEASRELIQKYVYDIAEKTGLTPGTAEYNRWCAHTNFSWPGLRDGSDGNLFLRYFADFNSRPEIGMGAFSGDIRNAPVLAMERTEVQNALLDIVTSFNTTPESAFNVANLIRNNVYSSGHGFNFGGGRYNAFNLTHVQGSARSKKSYAASSAVRIEQRASYMPLSAAHLVSNYQIISGRMNYLAKLQKPIEYSPRDLGVENNTRTFATKGVQQGVTPAGVAKVYVEYLSEAGLDTKYHVLHMMNPVVQTEAAKLVGIAPSEVNAAQQKAAKILKVDLDTYLAPGPFDANSIDAQQKTELKK